MNYFVIKSEKTITNRDTFFVLSVAVDAVTKQFPAAVIQEVEISFDAEEDSFSVYFIGDIEGEEFNWGYAYPAGIVEQ